MNSKLTICDHPLLHNALAQLRDKATSPQRFRECMEQAGMLLGLKALEELKLRQERVATPLRSALVRYADQPVVFAVILRAGLGLLPGVLRLFPEASVGHIGLYRNEETLNPVRYYVRLPKGLERSLVLLLDPMLATGGSAAEALRILKTDGARQIIFLSILATRQGIHRVHREHLETHIITAAVDPVLNRNGYIVPGLGDAGDRLFGT
jgi:uracil phosphoribosyltransferase